METATSHRGDHISDRSQHPIQDAVYVLHASQEKSKTGSGLPKLSATTKKSRIENND
jgi:hypothetical protein